MTEKKTSEGEGQRCIKAAAEGELKGILEYTEDPVVSTDMLHNSNSSIVDGGMTKVIDGDLVKVVVWYDNDGYRAEHLIEFPWRTVWNFPSVNVT